VGEVSLEIPPHGEGKSPASIVAETAATIAVLAALTSFLIGSYGALQSTWPMLWGGNFEAQPFWQFARIDSPPHRVFEWDRAWWLTLILPASLGMLASVLSDSANWLRQSPQQRAEARRAGRENLRRAQENVQLDQEKVKAAKQIAKENRKPMSGWKRLWIVLSVVIGAPVFAATHSMGAKAYVSVQPSAEVRELQGQAFWNALFEQAKREHRSVRSCVLPTVRMQSSFGTYYSVECDRLTINVTIEAFLLAFLPALAMWIVGVTSRWVYRGFRSAKAN
jgi:hypothetical protein